MTTGADRAVPSVRLTAFGVSLAALIVGALGGVARLAGSSSAIAPQPVIAQHGVLIVLGFFATLVMLVRSVQLRRRWFLLAPAVALGASVAMIAGADRAVTGAGYALAMAGLGVMIIATVRATRRNFAHEQMLVGAVAGLGGAVMSMSVSVDANLVIIWLSAFLVLTIAGERMHLGKLIFRRGAVRQARALLTASAVSLVLSLWSPRVGLVAFGLTMVAYAVWLARIDPARRMRRTASSRFMSNGVMSALVWLAIAGLVWMIDAVAGRALSDAGIHALMLGFAAGMVFAHAPTILSAVTGWRIEHHAVFYVHLALLHIALAARVAGDITNVAPLTRTGADATAAALLLFAIVTAGACVRAGLHARASRPMPSRPA